MEKTDKPKTESEAPRPSNTLHRVGFVITGVWIVGLLAYGAGRHRELIGLHPNELGDFAAGAFAPLAFLWLVLGFFQQGEELRYSGRALWLQGEELRNSVEQQRELVNVTREQLQFDSTMLAAEREELMRRARPILKLTKGMTATSGDGELKVDFAITNHGRPCTDVKVEISDGPLPLKRDVLATGEKVPFRRRFPPGPSEPFTVSVTYIDDRLMPGERNFTVSSEGSEFHIASDDPA